MARPTKIVWATPALEDLDEIAAYIALDKPEAARGVVHRALAAVQRLARFPDSGRRVPELGGKTYREVVVHPCRIIYRREGASVLIVHVTRGERLLRLDRLL